MVVDFRYGGEEETRVGGIEGHVYVLRVEPRAYFEAGPAAQVTPSHSSWTLALWMWSQQRD